MSTSDVPGFNPDNADTLAMGAWAQHDDGSLILVESNEANRVIYSVFDMSRDPPMEYRDSMPETSFKTTYSFDAANRKPLNEKWTWHDKTPFPWDRIIKSGIPDGSRMPSAEHVLNAAERIAANRKRHRENTAAERVAAELHLQGEEIDRGNFDHRMDRVIKGVGDIVSTIAGALRRMPGGRSGLGGRRDED